MIWESIPLMTVIDLLIAGVTGAALRMLYIHRQELIRAHLLLGVALMVVGLLVIALIYLADLFVMWVWPVFSSPASAMDAMTDLHLNYSWPLILLGVLCLFIGFTRTLRGLLIQTTESKKKAEQLEEANRDLYLEITARMQVKGALRKKEQYYQAVVETQTELISRSLPDTTLTFVNEAYCKYFGTKAHEVVGQSFLLLVAPDTREAARAHFASLVEEPRVVVYEHEVLLPDGSTAWNEWIATPILDEAGRVVEFQSVGRDITQQKRAQEALRRSEEKFAKAFHNSPDAIGITRLSDGHIIEANEGFERFSGYKREDVLGRTVLDLGLWADPDKRDAFVEIMREQGRVKNMALDVRIKSGEVRHCVAAAEMITLDEEPCTAVFIRDVTEHKLAEQALQESEARYRTFISNSYVGIWRIESRPPIPLDLPVEEQMQRVRTDAYYAECNDAAARILGYEVAEDVIGKPYGEVIPPAHEANEAVLRRVVEAGYNMVDAEFHEVDHRGRPIISLNSFFSTVEDGRVVQNWGISIDITERKRAEEALRESEARYRALYTNTPVMLHSTDAEERLLSVSDYWLDTLGYSRDEVLGRSATLFLTEASRHYAETTCMPAFRKTGILKEEALQFQKKNGAVIDTLLSAITERDAKGNLERSLVVAVDVTERKRAEEALRDSEARYRALVSNSYVGFWRIEFHTPLPVDLPVEQQVAALFKEGYVAECNDAFAQMYGFERADVLTGQGLSAFLNPDYTENISNMRSFVESEYHWLNRESEEIDPTGQQRCFLLSAFSNIDEGHLQWSWGVQIDITERKRAEKVLREYTDRLKVLREIDRAILAAESPESIAQVGLQHVHQLVPCAYANVAILDDEMEEARLIAFEPYVGEPDRRSLEDVAAFLDIERMRQGHVHRIADTLDLPETPPSHFIKALGLRSLLSVPLMAQEHLIGSINIGFDQPRAYTDEHIEITREAADSLAVAIEHARLFRQVRDANTRLHSLSRQLVQAQEAERRHLARELHDQIGQTLTAVKLSLQAVRGGMNAVSDLDEHIQIVSDALDEVRTLSLDLRPSMLDDLGLVPALRWLVDRQARQAGFEGCVLVSNLEDRLPAELEVTSFRVVQEALTNIARHAEARHVRVEARRTETDVEVVVTDDGKGFDVEQALKRAAAGTSLGLLGMEERVHLAGGMLTISSQVGQGTEVRLRLPVSI